VKFIVGAIGILSAVVLGGCASSSSDSAISATEKVGSVKSGVVTIAPAPESEGIALDALSGTYVPTAGLKYISEERGNALISFEGPDYIAIWEDARGVVAAHITEGGKVKEPAGILLSPLSNNRFDDPTLGVVSYRVLEQVASSSAGTIVVWIEYTYFETYVSGSSTLFSLAGARISPDGTVTRLSFPEAVSGYELDLTYVGHTPQGLHWVTADTAGFDVFYYTKTAAGKLQLLHQRISPTGPQPTANVLMADMAEPLSCPNRQCQSFPYASATTTASFAAWGYDNQSTRYFVYPFASGVPIVGDITTEGIPHAVSSHASGHRIAIGWYGSSIIRTVATISDQGVELGRTAIPYFSIFGTPRVMSDPTAELFWGLNTSYQGIQPDGQWVTCLNKVGQTSCDPFVADPNRIFQQYDTRDQVGYSGMVLGSSTMLESMPSVDFRYATPPPGMHPGVRLSIYDRSTHTFASEMVVNRRANTEELPALASDGNEYLVAWSDTRVSGETEKNAIFIQRVSASGVAYGAPLQVSATSDVVAVPRLIFDGKGYVVAWAEVRSDSEDFHLLAARIPATGGLTPSSVIEAVPKESLALKEFALTSDGKDLLVAWPHAYYLDDSLRDVPRTIAMKRISVETGVVGTTQTVAKTSVPAAQLSAPTFAFDGSKILLAWMETYASERKVRGAFIDMGAELPSGEPFNIFDDGGRIARFAVAGENGHFFALENEQSSDDPTFRLRGRAIASMGPSPESKWMTFGGDARTPLLAYANDRANFIAIWGDQTANGAGIKGAWIRSEDGSSHDPDGVRISDGLNTVQRAPAIAMRKDGRGLIAYEEFVKGATANAYRIRFRQIESGATRGTLCTSNEECGTRACVDGVCCNNLCAGGCGVCNAEPGTCTPKPKGTVCGEYGVYLCGGSNSVCPSRCTTNNECVSKSCVDGVCEQPSRKCIDDSHLRAEDGTIEDCGDYKCSANTCRNPCVEASDCRSGLICNFEGKCSAPPETINKDGCATAPARPEDALYWLLGCGALVVATRRRPSRGAR